MMAREGLRLGGFADRQLLGAEGLIAAVRGRASRMTANDPVADIVQADIVGQ